MREGSYHSLMIEVLKANPGRQYSAPELIKLVGADPEKTSMNNVAREVMSKHTPHIHRTKINKPGEIRRFYYWWDDAKVNGEYVGQVGTQAQPAAAPISRITDEDLVTFLAYPNLSSYQAIATKSAFYPGRGTALGLLYCALKLNGEAGELAEHVGKAMRDDGLAQVEATRDGVGHDILLGQLTPDRHQLIVKEVGDCLWYLSAICNELGISLAEAASFNLAKLKDRTDRDALRGSGDTR